MFVRRPLRDEVQRAIRERIVDGRLPADSGLNENRLATELGISRTPLREAMLGLEAHGFLTSAMGRGFRVPALDPGEFRDLAAVLAHLTPLAIELAPDPAAGCLVALHNLLQRAEIAAKRPGGEPAAAIAGLLPAFAAKTVAECPNEPLRGDIVRLEALCARYWYAAVAAGFAAATVLAHVRAVYAEFQGRRRQAAAALIRASYLGLVDQAAAVLT